MTVFKQPEDDEKNLCNICKQKDTVYSPKHEAWMCKHGVHFTRLQHEYMMGASGSAFVKSLFENSQPDRPATQDSVREE